MGTSKNVVFGYSYLQRDRYTVNIQQTTLASLSVLTVVTFEVRLGRFEGPDPKYTCKMKFYSTKINEFVLRSM